MEHGADEDQAIAALLHDAIEDQGESFGGSGKLAMEIEKRFGSAVLEIVLGCTDADTIPKPPWKERKLAYIKHVQNASAAVRLVSMADKLHNARCILSDYKQIGETLWQRFNTGKEGTLWYYRALVDAFRQASPEHRLVEELDSTVAEIERLALAKA